jgi:glycine reductase
MGDPALSQDAELELRRDLLERALRALETRIDQQTVFD